MFALRAKEMIPATLHESDDIEQAKKNYEMAHKTGVDAEYAAAKIIRAVEKNQMRLKIGRDSYIFHIIMRFMPGLGNLGHEEDSGKTSGLIGLLNEAQLLRLWRQLSRHLEAYA